MDISYFASTVNHPLCEYMDKIPFHKANQEKSKIYFLSGDPTVYGNQEFKMPELGYEILQKHISNPNNHGYTLSIGMPSARQAIAKLYKPKFPITFNDVTIQHGVSQGLLVALMSFTNSGDEILVPEIGFPIFQKLAPALKVNVKHYKLKSQSNFEIDLEQLQSLVTDKTRFLFVINPSNPMGTIFSRKHMEDILQFCDTNQIPIVADEVYHGQAFQSTDFLSFGEVTENVPVIVLSGVQKLLSVPGWCTSWSIIFDKNQYIAGVWRNILTSGSIFLHTNKFTQQALPQILEKVGIFTISRIAHLKPAYEDIFHNFEKMKGYKPVNADGTFYLTVLIDIGTFHDIKSDKQFADKLLEEQNIAVLPLTVFGGSLNGFRMMTFAKQELYKQFWARLQDFNTKHQS